jgi:uncharacterized protein
MKKAVRYGMVMLSCVQLFSFAHASIPERPQGGYVSDFASVLTPSERQNLESEISLYNASTSNEIAVVTVKSLDGDYIEHYAVDLFKKWGIGTKKHDNGVLLLVAIDDHKMRIEVGYGLEGALTDMLSSSIVRKEITPSFKEGKYYDGISRGVHAIILATQGEYQAEPEARQTSSSSIPFEYIFLGVVMVIQFLTAILGRSKSWWAGGVLGGVVGVILWLFGFLVLTSLLGVVVFGGLVGVGLLFDYIVSRKYKDSVSSGTNPPWWAGGVGGSFRSSGSSFGGFGGGRSGGGGASGSW